MNEDDQRLKNLIFFKFYGTDKEMEEAFPFIFLVIVLLVVCFGIYFIFFHK